MKNIKKILSLKLFILFFQLNVAKQEVSKNFSEKPLSPIIENFCSFKKLEIRDFINAVLKNLCDPSKTEFNKSFEEDLYCASPSSVYELILNKPLLCKAFQDKFKCKIEKNDFINFYSVRAKIEYLYYFVIEENRNNFYIKYFSNKINLKDILESIKAFLENEIYQEKIISYISNNINTFYKKNEAKKLESKTNDDRFNKIKDLEIAPILRFINHNLELLKKNKFDKNSANAFLYKLIEIKDNFIRVFSCEDYKLIMETRNKLSFSEIVKFKNNFSSYVKNILDLALLKTHCS